MSDKPTIPVQFLDGVDSGRSWRAEVWGSAPKLSIQKIQILGRNGQPLPTMKPKEGTSETLEELRADIVRRVEGLTES